MVDVWEILRSGGEINNDTPDKAEYTDALLNAEMLRIEYNSTVLSASDRRDLLSKIVGYEVDSEVRVVPPVYFDFGFKIKLGKGVLVNYDCSLLDTGDITIGDNVLIGPGSKIVTASHPFDLERRRKLGTSCKPVVIKDDVWLGAGVIVLPGVTIGARSIIGAGAVVTKDIPDDVVAVGNPARVIRDLRSSKAERPPGLLASIKNRGRVK